MLGLTLAPNCSMPPKDNVKFENSNFLETLLEVSVKQAPIQ